MNRIAALVCLLALSLSTLSFAQVGSLFADIGLNKDVFFPPDQVEIWVRGANPGLEMPVDIYLSILTPDRKELFAPEFMEMAHPWIPNVVLPKGFNMDWTPIYRYALPSMAFPLAAPGQYMASLWLCAAGTQDRLTLGSSQQFRIAPCDRRSWVNDNLIWSTTLNDEGVWLGLSNGAGLISYDGNLRSIWRNDEGPRTNRSLTFKAYDGSLMVGGESYGLSLREPYGWRSVMDNPGSPGCVFGVLGAVGDNEGTTWVLHGDRGAFGASFSRLARYWPSGYVEDLTSKIPGRLLGICSPGAGELCAIATDGLHLHNGDSFDFYGIEGFASASSITIYSVDGDMRRNVWMCLLYGGEMSPVLLKYDLKTQQLTEYDKDTPGLLSMRIYDMASDPVGNVYFACYPSGISIFDGGSFTAFSTDFIPHHLAVGLDGTIFCAAYGRGLRVFKDGVWLSYENPEPEIRSGGYQFAKGLPEGQAYLAFGSASTTRGGFEILGAEGFSTVYHDELPIWVTGVYPGQDNLWAWGMYEGVYMQTDTGWVNTTPPDAAGFGKTNAVLEDPAGTPYMLMDTALFRYDDATWCTIESPELPQGDAFTRAKIDRQGRIYLGQTGASWCIHVRETDGSWHSISTNDLLPADPVWFSLSPEDVLYVTGIDPDGRWYVSIVEDQDVTTFWLDDLGWATAFVHCIDFDLAGRAWIMTRALDDSAKIIIYDPADESFDEIPWSSGMASSSANYNAAVSFHAADQSFRDMGVLWWLGPSCPTRINLAPRTELLLDKAAYSAGDTMQVDAYFANQAGSIPIDWYAAAEDEAGNLFYWPTYTQAKTAAFHGLFVPTDTALILQLDNIVIPGDVPPGHYKWKTGFTRAGDSMWLGLGFTATGEFDITARP